MIMSKTTEINNEIERKIVEISAKVEAAYKILEASDGEYRQSDLLESIEKNKDEFSTLHELILRFNGLCELITNYVIMEDLMGKPVDKAAFSNLNRFYSLKEYKKEDFDMRSCVEGVIELINISEQKKNQFQQKITLFNMNQPRVKQCHIMDVTNFFQKVLAYLFDIYPFNIFSFHEKPQIDKQVNQALLQEKLNGLEDGFYIKFIVFQKGFLSMEGHSMLIKKTGETYAFFDPNVGEEQSLDIDALCNKINASMLSYKGSKMVFLDGKQFIQELVPDPEEQKEMDDLNYTNLGK